MPSNIKPADGHLVVKFVRPSAKGENGLVVPENLDAAPTFGRVVAVGSGRELATGTGLHRETVPYAVGDVVKFKEAVLVHPDGKAGPEFGVVPVEAVVCSVDGFVEHDEAEFRLDRAMAAAQNKPGLVVPRKAPVLTR